MLAAEVGRLGVVCNENSEDVWIHLANALTDIRLALYTLPRIRVH